MVLFNPYIISIYLLPTPPVELFHGQHVDQPTLEDFLQVEAMTNV